jgi:hypothetical protein
MNADDVISRLAGRLSLGRRIATVVALVGGLGVSAVVGLLWATEAGLPARTHLAFAGLVLGGLVWAGYAGWVLTRRTPLFARDRVIAAWIGVVACCVVAVPVAAVTVRRTDAAPVALAPVVALLALAAANLWRARRHRAALLRRKRRLGG